MLANRGRAQTRTVFYTPESSLTTVKTLDADLNILTFRADLWISEHVNPNASSTAAATATPLRRTDHRRRS